MDYLNFHTSTLDDARLISANVSHIAVWLLLQRFCIGQENSGRIRRSKNWSANKWLLVARVDSAILFETTELWRWHGDDLRLWAYPLESQKIVQAQRVGGRIGGKRRAEKLKGGDAAANSSSPSKLTSSSPSKLTSSSPSKLTSSSPSKLTSSSPQGHLQRKGMKGKGIEKKRNSKEKEMELSLKRAEILFELFPRHVGKRDALTVIVVQLQNVSYAKLRAKVIEYAAAVNTWPVEQRAFVPNPANWFRQGRYEDDPAEWQPKPVNGAARKGHPLPEDFNPDAPFAHTGGLSGD